MGLSLKLTIKIITKNLTHFIIWSERPRAKKSNSIHTVLYHGSSFDRALENLFARQRLIATAVALMASGSSFSLLVAELWMLEKTHKSIY